MAEWIYFLRPPREDFAATMTDREKEVWATHFERFQAMLAAGDLVLVGPTLGRTNIGVAVFEAPDEEAARRVVAEDPVVVAGLAEAELHQFRISLLRGRDPAPSGSDNSA